VPDLAEGVTLPHSVDKTLVMGQCRGCKFVALRIRSR
jgi:hypothetical protein